MNRRTKMAKTKKKASELEYACNEDCNNCNVLRGQGFRQLTVILNALYEVFGAEVYEVVQHYCPNFTVCADCRIDDFCHMEGCELLAEAQRFGAEWHKAKAKEKRSK